MNTFDLQKKLIDSITKLIDGKIKEMKNNSTVIKNGIIVSANGKNSYNVQINGREYVARSNFNHSPNSVVWVIIANGDYKNMFILYDQNINIT